MHRDRCARLTSALQRALIGQWDRRDRLAAAAIVTQPSDDPATLEDCGHVTVLQCAACALAAEGVSAVSGDDRALRQWGGPVGVG